MARNVQINERRLKKEREIERFARENGYTSREWKRINEQDAIVRRKQYKLLMVVFLLFMIVCAMAYGVFYFVFRSHDYELRFVYDKNDSVFGIPENLYTADTAAPFSEGLCVTDTDVNSDAVYTSALSGGVFDLNNAEVIYAHDIFTTRSPASLTKIMTALVALKYGNPDDIVVVTDTALDIEYGSSVCEIQPGDQFSLKQLIYGMLIASGNDAAMMIAEHVGGTVDNFVAMMNEEARSLGATKTHFENPHGLTDSDHYTCVYDLYLMFRAAMQYDLFVDIIGRKNYYAEYTDSAGNACAITWETTNHYFTGEAYPPDQVNIYGGKTGTTDDAGACLVLLARDQYGNPFINVVLHASDKDALYEDMNSLLSLIPN